MINIRFQDTVTYSLGVSRALANRANGKSPRKAKVTDLDVAVLIHQDVRGFYVSMDNVC